MKSKIIINKKNVTLGLCSAMALSSLPIGVIFAEDLAEASLELVVDDLLESSSDIILEDSSEELLEISYDIVVEELGKDVLEAIIEKEEFSDLSDNIEFEVTEFLLESFSESPTFFNETPVNDTEEVFNMNAYDCTYTDGNGLTWTIDITINWIDKAFDSECPVLWSGVIQSVSFESDAKSNMIDSSCFLSDVIDLVDINLNLDEESKDLVWYLGTDITFTDISWADDIITIAEDSDSSTNEITFLFSEFSEFGDGIRFNDKSENITTLNIIDVDLYGISINFWDLEKPTITTMNLVMADNEPMSLIFVDETNNLDTIDVMLNSSGSNDSIYLSGDAITNITLDGKSSSLTSMLVLTEVCDLSVLDMSEGNINAFLVMNIYNDNLTSLEVKNGGLLDSKLIVECVGFNTVTQEVVTIKGGLFSNKLIVRGMESTSLIIDSTVPKIESVGGVISGNFGIITSKISDVTINLDDDVSEFTFYGYFESPYIDINSSNTSSLDVLNIKGASLEKLEIGYDGEKSWSLNELIVSGACNMTLAGNSYIPYSITLNQNINNTMSNINNTRSSLTFNMLDSFIYDLNVNLGEGIDELELVVFGEEPVLNFLNIAGRGENFKSVDLGNSRILNHVNLSGISNPAENFSIKSGTDNGSYQFSSWSGEDLYESDGPIFLKLPTKAQNISLDMINLYDYYIDILVEDVNSEATLTATTGQVGFWGEDKIGEYNYLFTPETSGLVAKDKSADGSAIDGYNIYGILQFDDKGQAELILDVVDQLELELEVEFKTGYLKLTYDVNEFNSDANEEIVTLTENGYIPYGYTVTGEILNTSESVWNTVVLMDGNVLYRTNEANVGSKTFTFTMKNNCKLEFMDSAYQLSFSDKNITSVSWQKDDNTTTGISVMSINGEIEDGIVYPDNVGTVVSGTPKYIPIGSLVTVVVKADNILTSNDVSVGSGKTNETSGVTTYTFTMPSNEVVLSTKENIVESIVRTLIYEGDDLIKSVKIGGVPIIADGNGTSVNAGTEITVELEYGELFRTQRIVLVDDNGTITDISIDVIDGFVTFEMPDKNVTVKSIETMLTITDDTYNDYMSDFSGISISYKQDSTTLGAEQGDVVAWTFDEVDGEWKSDKYKSMNNGIITIPSGVEIILTAEESVWRSLLLKDETKYKLVIGDMEVSSVTDLRDDDYGNLAFTMHSTEDFSLSIANGDNDVESLPTTYAITFDINEMKITSAKSVTGDDLDISSLELTALEEGTILTFEVTTEGATGVKYGETSVDLVNSEFTILVEEDMTISVVYNKDESELKTVSASTVYLGLKYTLTVPYEVADSGGVFIYFCDSELTYMVDYDSLIDSNGVLYIPSSPVLEDVKVKEHVLPVLISQIISKIQASMDADSIAMVIDDFESGDEITLNVDAFFEAFISNASDVNEKFEGLEDEVLTLNAKDLNTLIISTGAGVDKVIIITDESELTIVGEDENGQQVNPAITDVTIGGENLIGLTIPGSVENLVVSESVGNKFTVTVTGNESVLENIDFENGSSASGFVLENKTFSELSGVEYSINGEFKGILENIAPDESGGVGSDELLPEEDLTIDPESTPEELKITTDLDTATVSYTKGKTADTLEVKVNLSSVTYQWYSSADGLSWSKLNDEIDSSYTPSTSSTGTTYYKCIITYDNKDTIVSNSACIKVSSSTNTSTSGSSSSSSSGGSSSSSSSIITTTTEINTENTTATTIIGIDVANPEVEDPSVTLKINEILDLANKLSSITDDVEITAIKDEYYKVVISKYSDLLNASYGGKHWGRHAVALCLEQGYFNGVYGTEGDEVVDFGVDDYTTRLEIVRVLANMVQDISGVEAYDGKFTDVEVESEGANAVAWAVINGITLGVTDTTFEPDLNVTRQQMAMFFSRFVDTLGLELPELFDKVIFSDDYNIWNNDEVKESIRKLQQAGIIQGYDGYFNPNDNISRAEFATMIENLVDLLTSQNK